MGITAAGTNTFLQGQYSLLVAEKNGKFEYDCGTQNIQDNGDEQYHCAWLIKLEANDEIRIKVGAGTINLVYFYGKYVRPF